MKNTLLTTTAIALTGFAGTASAVEVAAGAVNLSINGNFRTTVAFTASSASSVDGQSPVDHDGLDVLTNSEVHFNPSITLDNGITIGADIELEGNTHDDQIDESSILAFGDFGRLEIGSVDSAGKKQTTYAPDVSMVFANSTSLTSFADFTGVTTAGDLAGDAERIVYFTPRFGGFQGGVSYARNDSEESGSVNNNQDGIETDFFDIGVNYNGKFGGVDLAFSARYGTSDRALNATALEDGIQGLADIGEDATGMTADELAALTAEQVFALADTLTAEQLADIVAQVGTIAGTLPGSRTITGVGLKLGFGHISFGGGYLEIDNDIIGQSNQTAYDIGVSYGNGPMSYSLTYVAGEAAGNVSESEIIVAAATYAVSSAFNVGVSLSRYDTDVTVGTENDVDGTILALSAQFNF